MHRLVDFDQNAAWLQQAANLVQSGFEAARSEVGSRIASFTTKPVSAAPAGPTTEEIIGQAVTDLNLRMDQVRAGNELSARDLGQGIERIRNAVEENHRETVAKLVQLAERVERVERQAAAVPARDAYSSRRATNRLITTPRASSQACSQDGAGACP